MSDIILHHYQLSPFSEKIRRILAFKEIPWRSVETPLLLPKADLAVLTGAYRRAPVMQIGADVYCDSALIARRLEQLYPEPTVISPALAGAVAIWEDWADNRLVHYVVAPMVVELSDELPPGFIEDRGKMTANWTREAFVEAAPHGLEETQLALDALDALASHLRATDFVLGDNFTLADAACFNPIGFLRKCPALASEIECRAAIAQWVKRIEDFGPVSVESLSGSEALAIARDAQPQDIQGDSTSSAGYRPGDVVSIVADDYGLETLTGEVLRARADDLAILRDDKTLGAVAVHYPRAGY